MTVTVKKSNNVSEILNSNDYTLERNLVNEDNVEKVVLTISYKDVKTVIKVFANSASQSITNDSLADISEAQVNKISNRIYTGKEKKPTVKLTIGSKSLTNKKDFTLKRKLNYCIIKIVSKWEGKDFFYFGLFKK